MNKNFLLEDYLRATGVSYKTSGKNIGEGWIGLQECPYCKDKRFHLGINKKAGIYSCWICKKSGNIISLIQELENTSQYEAIQIYKNFSISNEEKSSSLLEAIENARGITNSISKVKLEQKPDLQLPDNVLPLKEALERFSILQEYISSRGFDEKDVESWGNIYLCPIGKYSGRIIFPVYIEGKFVNYSGRTIINQSLRYLNCPNSEAIIPMKDCLYNYDKWNIGESVIITEGILDCLKTQKLLNKKVIALFGKEISDNQLLLISKKKPSKIYLFLDRDAWNKALEIAGWIKLFTNCVVDIITPELKDPDSYNNKEDMEGLFK